MQQQQFFGIVNRAIHPEKILLESKTFSRELQRILVTKLRANVLWKLQAQQYLQRKW